MQASTLDARLLTVVVYLLFSAQQLPGFEPNDGLRDAVHKSVRLIDRTSAKFLETKACFTCHSQTLSVMVLREAGQLGVEIDEENLRRQIDRASEVSSPTNGMRVDTVGHGLWTLNLGRRVADESTERMATYLLDYEPNLGHWEVTVNRPPAEASDFATNYVALRGVNRYGTAGQVNEIQARRSAVTRWMEKTEATTTEDEVFRLYLAVELQSERQTIDLYTRDLLNMQHESGGWAQRTDMKPDAYATGSVLVALHDAGGIPAIHPSWQRGIAYLLKTQLPDGSWHVATRAKPIQEYFESGFPHGKDQFISAFATGWATQALLITVKQESAKADEQPHAPERASEPCSNGTSAPHAR